MDRIKGVIPHFTRIKRRMPNMKIKSFYMLKSTISQSQEGLFQLIKKLRSYLSHLAI